MLFISTWESSRTYSKPTYVMYNGLPCLVSPGVNNKPIELPEGDVIGKQIAELNAQRDELLAALKEANSTLFFHNRDEESADCGKAYQKAQEIIKKYDHA